MRRASVTRAAALLLAAAGSVTPAQAQAARTPPAGAGPYERLSIGIAGAVPTSDGSLGAWWTSAPGARLDLHASFHVAEIGASVATFPFRARTDTQPAFRAYVIGLDWRVTGPARWPVRPLASVATGGFLTTFDGVATKGLSKESEIFIGGTTGAMARIRGGTSLTATFTALQVLTSTPIRLTYASIGVSQDVATPRWLRGVLQ